MPMVPSQALMGAYAYRLCALSVVIATLASYAPLEWSNSTRSKSHTRRCLNLLAWWNLADFWFVRLLVAFASLFAFAGKPVQLRGQTFPELTTPREIRAYTPDLLRGTRAMIAKRDRFPAALFHPVLVRIKGRLVEEIRGAHEDRLLFPDGTHAFTSTLFRSGHNRHPLATGNLLSTTAVYALNADENHEARFFEVRLHYPADRLVLEKVSWWTMSHAGWVVALLVIVVFVISGWLATTRWQASDTAQRKLELYFDSVAAVLIVLDAKGGIARWNSMAVEVFRLSYAEVQGKDLGQCGIRWLGEPVAPDFWLRDEFMDKRRELKFEQEGESRSLSFTVRRVHNPENGGLVGFLINAFDTTNHRALEVQLRQGQKLESIGQLAAGIAHEINTPVQYIGDNVRFLQDTFRELISLNVGYARLLAAVRSTEVTPEMLEEVSLVVEKADVDYLLEEIPKAFEQTLEGVSRIAELVGAMKEFSHPGTGEKVPLDLNHAIESTIAVARNEWKYVADMKVELDPILPLVFCFPGEFSQVVLNLIVNAAHAIADVAASGGPEKGLITIRTRSLPGRVEVLIQDTGGGIPKDIRPRIFDPFFTTKEIGKGTGQGLAIARSVVVDKHQGTLDFETEEGKGTSFIIRLPCEAVPSPDLTVA